MQLKGRSRYAQIHADTRGSPDTYVSVVIVAVETNYAVHTNEFGHASVRAWCERPLRHKIMWFDKTVFSD